MKNPKETVSELKKKAALLEKAASILSVQAADLPRVVERFQKEIEEMDADIKKLRK